MYEELSEIKKQFSVKSLTFLMECKVTECRLT